MRNVMYLTRPGEQPLCDLWTRFTSHPFDCESRTPQTAIMVMSVARDGSASQPAGANPGLKAAAQIQNAVLSDLQMGVEQQAGVPQRAAPKKTTS